jgi:LDH2 family malate/lactate/ureidoglycolate dehydrogenase
MEQNMCRLFNNDYINVGTQILTQTGVPEQEAKLQMEVLLNADLRAVFTHGIFRLPRYVELLDNGHINPAPKMVKAKTGRLIQVMDGDYGLGAVVSHHAMQEAVNICAEHGVGIVGVKNSNHFGIAAHYAEMPTRLEQIGIAMSNTGPAIAPTGGLKAMLGNNPWSISVPTRLGYPITLDMANSIVARGRIRLAAQRGESIPLGWALNSKGEPTTDPVEALKGMVLPFGDYKGYGITLMIEVLSGVLTGAEFGEKLAGYEANRKRSVGHLFIALDVGAFMDKEEFKDRMDELIHSIKSMPRIKAGNEVLLPGEKEWKALLDQDDGTVAIPDRVYTALGQLCDAFHVALPKTI